MTSTEFKLVGQRQESGNKRQLSNPQNVAYESVRKISNNQQVGWNEVDCLERGCFR
jgi:hypothetical protein